MYSPLEIALIVGAGVVFTSAVAMAATVVREVAGPDERPVVADQRGWFV
jgi:hypothetical protein